MGDIAITHMSSGVDLISHAQTDDRVFCDLYDQFFDPIYAYTIRRLGDRDTAEDVVSATFEKVFLHLDRFDKQRGTFQAWIYKIATNEIIDHVRKMKRIAVTDPHDMVQDVAGTSQDALSVVIRHDESERVRIVLRRLPVRYQEILQLKFFSELSNGDIAEILEVTVGNAGVLLHRALERFHKEYTAYEHRS